LRPCADIHKLERSNSLKDINKIGLQLFLVSLVILFQELILIRWLGTQIRVLAYFPNLILISTFLGLGVGCLQSSKRSFMLFWPIILLVLIASTYGMSRIIFTHQNASEHLWLLYYDLPKNALEIKNISLPILFFFVVSTFSFIPLGQRMGLLLEEYRVRSKPLIGYAVNIVGSLSGIVLFSALSFINSFPVVWFTLLLISGIFIIGDNYGKYKISYLVLSLFMLLSVHLTEKAEYYSPYYSLSINKNAESGDCNLLANGSLHQIAMHLTRDQSSRNDYHKNVLESYHLPYNLLKKTPQSALVLGAGTGNDVAVLLDQGIKRIDAVEIDPMIVALGKKHHPDKPYDSSGVRVFTTDARSFLNNSTDKYDLIIYGTLDSMTRLSALSNVRLDNFVYTFESIMAAKKHLTSEGGMVLYFMYGEEYIYHSLMSMLSKAFNEYPLIHYNNNGLFNIIFMCGPAYKDYKPLRASSFLVNKDLYDSFLVPSDDWPFLYLNGRGISVFYKGIILQILVITLLFLIVPFPELRKSISVRGVDFEMFLLGMAFLLLETRSVTEMNLIWGATWLTSAVVFGAILFMVLASTLLIQIKSFPFIINAILLIVALIISYIIPVQIALGYSLISKLFISIFLIGSPLFFASSCFVQIFSKREKVDIAFGWNILGSVVGGLLEFISLQTGIKSLIIVAIIIYLIVFLIKEHNKSLFSN